MHGSPQPVVTSSSSTYTELVPPNRQHVELSTLQQKVQEPQVLTIEPLPKSNEPPQQFQGEAQTNFSFICRHHCNLIPHLSFVKLIRMIFDISLIQNLRPFVCDILIYQSPKKSNDTNLFLP